MQHYSSNVYRNRQSMMLAIKNILGGAVENAERHGIIDSMVYGKKFGHTDIVGVDYTPKSDSMGVTIRLGEHICDLVVVLRCADPRIGLFIPNDMLHCFERGFADPVQAIVGENLATQNVLGLFKAGFHAYPLDHEQAPRVVCRAHEHGCYVEFCLRGKVVEMVADSLAGRIDPDIGGDALGYAALHIINTVASYAHEAQHKQKAQHGLMESIEFTYPQSTAEIIRNYGIEPKALQCLREPDQWRDGLYRITFDDADKERYAHFFEEVVYPCRITEESGF